jgi:hypothetical protein
MRVRASTPIHAFAGRRHRAIRGHLDREKLDAIESDDTALDRTARHRATRDHQRDAMRVGIRPMARSRPDRCSHIADPHENHATVPIRQAHGCIHEVLVAQWRLTFGEKLGGELFAAREKTANVGVREHDGR